MKVELGNAKAVRVPEDRNGPTVTYVEVPDDWTYEVAQDGARMTIGPDGDPVEVTSAADLADRALSHITNAMLFRDGIFHLPGQEALLGVMAAQQQEGVGAPLWVWSDNEDFAKLLGAFYNCPVGRPDDVEDSHFTNAGPPGVGPLSDAENEARAAEAQANQPNEE